MHRNLRDYLVGIAQFGVGMLILAGAVAFSACNLCWPVLTWYYPAACFAIVGVIGAVFLYWSRPRGKDFGPLHFVFLGLFVSGTGLLTVAAALSMDTPPAVDPAASCLDVRVVVDVSDAVLFPNEKGECTGPSVFDDNALAKTVLAACTTVDAFIGEPSPGGTLDFWSWLKKYGARLVNFEPPPAPNRGWTQKKAELYIFDGEDVYPVPAAKGLAPALRREWTRPGQWPLRTTGLPVQVRSLLKKGEGRTITFLLATGDVNSARNKVDWEKAAAEQGGPPPDVTVKGILLPSLPRSGLAALRSAGAKAEILKCGQIPLVRLDKAAPVDSHVTDEVGIPLFAYGSSVPALDPGDNPEKWAKQWNEPADLDALRRTYFGPGCVKALGSRLESRFRDEISSTIPSSPGGDDESSHDSRTRPMQALYVLLLVMLGLGILTLPSRTIALMDDAATASRGMRALLIFLGLGVGLGVTIWTVHLLWPGHFWQQSGLPALAIWGYVASWTVLVPWGFMYKMWEFGRAPKPQAREIATKAVVFVALAAHPALGLVLGIQNWIINLAVLAVPPLAACLLCLVHNGESGRIPGEPLLRIAGVHPDAEAGGAQPQRWARPVRWGTLAPVVALWVALVLIGVSPAGEGEHRRLWVLALLGSVAVAMTSVLWLISLWEGQSKGWVRAQFTKFFGKLFPGHPSR